MGLGIDRTTGTERKPRTAATRQANTSQSHTTEQGELRCVDQPELEGAKYGRLTVIQRHP